LTITKKSKELTNGSSRIKSSLVHPKPIPSIPKNTPQKQPEINPNFTQISVKASKKIAPKVSSQDRIETLENHVKPNSKSNLEPNKSKDAGTKPEQFESRANRDFYSRKELKALAENIKYCGPSPDEISLLTGCKDSCDFFFVGADAKRVVIQTPKVKFEVEKLVLNEFESNRKMMSVLIRFQNKGKLFLFVLKFELIAGFLMCKGADQSILSRLDQNAYAQQPSLNNLKNHVISEINTFSRKGFRGLLMAVRVLSPEQMKYFKEYYRDICEMDLDSKKKAYQDFLKELESELVVIGGSAVEDKLQEDLCHTIESLRHAQMKIWVLTGDKMETAENIAISSGLFGQVRIHSFIYKAKSEDIQIKRLSTIDDIPLDGSCSQFENLVVEGRLLTFLYDDPLSHNNNKFKSISQAFENFILKFKCAVFCRTTPNQKAYMVSLVRKAGFITLAIGDGANDVNMIQKAHVGIGIIGNEGKQAANCSDFAVAYFKDIKR
jgi:phospholipid-transporting ATPase